MKVESSKDLMATNKAVDTILNLKHKDHSIHGSIAELGQVNEKYSMALETVAGKSLFNIVVDNDKTAVKYINYLKDKRIGSATFLPLNKVNAKFRLDDSVLNKKGVIDYALNLIKYDKQYENIFHLVFQDTLVIENIKDARGIGIGDYKMVTTEGDLVMKSGAMSGGFKARNKSLGAFKDNKDAEKLEKLDNKIFTLKSTLDELKDQKEESERELYQLRQDKVELEGDVAKLEKLLSIEGQDTQSIQKEIEAILQDKKIIETNLSKIDKDIEQINKQIEKEIENKNKLKSQTGNSSSALTNLDKAEEKRDKLKEKLRSISSQIDAENIKINNVLLPEINNMEKILKEGTHALENMNKNLDEMKKQISTYEEEYKKYKAKEKELSKDYKDFIAKRDALKEKRKKVEEKYEKEYVKFDKIKEKIAGLNYAINDYETLNNTLNEELEILYEQTKVEFIENTEDDKSIKDGEKKIKELLESIKETINKKSIDIKELQNKVNNLKTRLNSFGSINMKAVEIYDKLSEEFNLLIDKRENLTAEKKEILNLIAEIDIKKKEKFLETFEQLKDNFVRVFSTLSTKGDAELLIENEKDIFNSGVEIKVRMTRHNYLDIKSLSGGEKTITAIAFIFAVQEFNPASFYIFDEVDAALDIMNAEKLGKLIAGYSKKAQYVVVSHSEHLIQSAETIYGVTMNDAKISDVVTLDLRDMADYVDQEVAPAK